MNAIIQTGISNWPNMNTSSTTIYNLRE